MSIDADICVNRNISTDLNLNLRITQFVLLIFKQFGVDFSINSSWNFPCILDGFFNQFYMVCSIDFLKIFH